MKSLFKKKQKTNKTDVVVYYIAGSMILCLVAAIVIPQVLPRISGVINKALAKEANKQREEEDWGPVMERKVG